MGGKIRRLIALLLLLAGIGVMSYPAVSSYLNSIHSSYAVQTLNARLERMDSGSLDRQRQLAQQYNEALTADPGATILEDYGQILDFGNGIMGSLRIPSIGVELSVYHGVSEAVLQKGVGHMPRSSFPIGGAGNHSVLTGHTGLPSAELFTDLVELQEGDLFCLEVLNETLVYEVDRITVVWPHEVDSLTCVPGQDYCTLVTCTPYGINSHRLLVRGRRVQSPQSTPVMQPTATGKTAVGVSWGMLPVVVILLALQLRRKKRKWDQEGGS